MVMMMIDDDDDVTDGGGGGGDGWRPAPPRPSVIDGRDLMWYLLGPSMRPPACVLACVLQPPRSCTRGEPAVSILESVHID
jgi:hypothetical protein